MVECLFSPWYLSKPLYIEESIEHKNSINFEYARISKKTFPVLRDDHPNDNFTNESNFLNVKL